VREAIQNGRMRIMKEGHAKTPLCVRKYLERGFVLEGVSVLEGDVRNLANPLDHVLYHYISKWFITKLRYYYYYLILKYVLDLII
jgi:hypothetical protein